MAHKRPTAGTSAARLRHPRRFTATPKTWIVGGAIAVVVMAFGAAVSAPIAADPVAAREQTAPAPTVSASPSAEFSPEDSAEFTDEAPADPATATLPEASVAVPDTTSTDGSALALLATLPVKGKAPKTGYDRSGMFGTAWLDVDRNGCDTRNDILARDLTGISLRGPCTVLGGQLVSPFTGGAVAFIRGNTTSTLVQIDHLVSLSNAWQTGAQQLTQQQRISLANDPLNLLAVDGSSNAQKGDGDTATWLPANKPFRCAYVALQVSVKATYGLWVTTAERDAMARVLSACPDQDAVTSPFTPTRAPVVVVEPTPAPAPAQTQAPAPAPAQTPAPAPAPAPTSVRYANCTAVRAAGASPLYAGQPGYETPRLDRDGDGVACE